MVNLPKIRRLECSFACVTIQIASVAAGNQGLQPTNKSRSKHIRNEALCAGSMPSPRKLGGLVRADAEDLQMRLRSGEHCDM